MRHVVDLLGRRGSTRAIADRNVRAAVQKSASITGEVKVLLETDVVAGGRRLYDPPVGDDLAPFLLAPGSTGRFVTGGRGDFFFDSSKAS